MAGVVTRHDDQTGRSLVEAVHDAGPRGAARGRPASAASQQRVHQRARAVAGRGVHDHSRGLVDDKEVLILVDDLERDFFGLSVRAVGLGDLELDHVAGGDSIRRICGLAIDRDQVALDQARGRRAAQIAGMLRDEAVKSRRRDVSDQAALGLRIRYPTISSKTPMLMAESARLKTGQKWKFTKSVTPPPLITRSEALPRAPPRISPSTASARRSPGWRIT